MKTVIWVASSKKDLGDLPKQVMRAFGYALYQAQQGSNPDIAKVMKGFGSAEVLELVDDDHGSTFRAVYTVRFADMIFVLHVFQKKSKRGIETPKRDMELMNLSGKSKSWLSCLFCHILQPLFGLLIQACPAKRLQNLTKNPAQSNFLDFPDKFIHARLKRAEELYKELKT